jgi:hypothetical protein
MTVRLFYRTLQFTGPFIAVLMTACTFVAVQPMHQVTLATVDKKLSPPVRLELSTDFRSAKWERKIGSDTRVLPLGENLVALSKKTITNVFAKVVDDADAPNVNIISPKVVSIEQALPVWAKDETKLTISVEWTLRRPDGQVVWTQTVQGVGTGPSGNVFNDGERSVVRVQRALNDLFQNTQDQMTSSLVLRSLQ